MEVQSTHERFALQNVGFTRSEVTERLLGHDEIPASENPQNLSLVSDITSTSSVSLRRDSNNYVEAMQNGPSTTGTKLKDYIPRILWNSIWLDKVVLIGFCALFTALLIALILLHHFSEASLGLSVQISQNKYCWTYGPTAGEFSLSTGRVQTSNLTMNSLCCRHQPVATGRLSMPSFGTLAAIAKRAIARQPKRSP